MGSIRLENVTKSFGELQVILRTEEVPRNIVCVRSDLDPKVVQKVEET